MSTRLVYVCEGGDCCEKGSVELFERLKGMLAEKDPEEASCRVRKYPCFGGCEHGINITLWPDKVFYSGVTAKDLPQIVDQLENGGPPLEQLTGAVKPDVEELLWELLDSPY